MEEKMSSTFEASDKKMALEVASLEARIAKINETRKLLAMVGRSLGSLYGEVVVPAPTRRPYTKRAQPDSDKMDIRKAITQVLSTTSGRLSSGQIAEAIFAMPDVVNKPSSVNLLKTRVSVAASTMKKEGKLSHTEEGYRLA